MTRECFNRQFAGLVAAYPGAQKLSDETQDVYWEMLKDIPEEKFIHGVRKCLARLKFFPSISELGEASIPAITRLAPYNPYVYHDPLELNWQDQIAEEKQAGNNRLPHNVKGLIDSIN